VAGVLGLRVVENGDLIGYDILDVTSGQRFAVARLRETFNDSDWFVFGKLIYAFSTTGFQRANEILTCSAVNMDCRILVFVDEFGRLEKNGLGLYQGAIKVAEKLREGGVAVFTCRTDLVEVVEKLLKGRATSVSRYAASEVDTLRAEVMQLLHHSSEL
jgi:nucleoside-triphosphatase THEP1